MNKKYLIPLIILTLFVTQVFGAELDIPTYSNVSVVSTNISGDPISFFITWDGADIDNFGQYSFSANFTGSFLNTSWENFTTTPETLEFTGTLPSGIGTYAWCVYGTSTSELVNATMCENPEILVVFLPEVTTQLILEGIGEGLGNMLSAFVEGLTILLLTLVVVAGITTIIFSIGQIFHTVVK